jgi:hypothetical protein
LIRRLVAFVFCEWLPVELDAFNSGKPKFTRLECWTMSD